MSTEINADTFETDLVRDLEIDISCAKVRFQGTSDDKIQVIAENLTEGRYDCRRNENRLTVSYRCPRLALFPRLNYTTPEITLYLPANFALDHVKLDVGAGKVFMEEIPFSCKNMFAQLGAGQWHARQLSVSDSLRIETGAGNVRLEKTAVNDLLLGCGAGSCSFGGRIGRNLKISCGVGNCRLLLENKPEDFDYDISCGLGKINVNGDRINCTGSKRTAPTGHALGTALLECGIGTIELISKGNPC